MILLLKKERRRSTGDIQAADLRARLVPHLAAARAALTTVSFGSPLTERERVVFELLEAQLSSMEIAACLVISVPAVRRHAANAYRKLRLTNRRPADRYVSRTGSPSRRRWRRAIVRGPRMVPIRGSRARHPEHGEHVDSPLRLLPRHPAPSRGPECAESPRGLVVGPTAHELAVLRLLVGRPATREMAHELDIAPFIVKRYTSSFHQKLQVQDRRQAVAPDRTLRLLPIQSDVQERLATDARRAPAYLLPLRRPVPDDCS